MFKCLKQEVVLKGIESVEPGKFESSDGKEIAYDGYTRVTICLKDKNNKYVDIKCRIANSTDGQLLVKKLSEVELMTKIYVDVEVQVNSTGNAKCFITNFSLFTNK